MPNAVAKKAVTLVELLITILIVSVTVGAILQAYTYHLYLIETARGISVAVADLRDVMEKILNTPFSSVVPNFPNGLADGDADYYKTLVGGYTLKNQEIIVSYTDSGTDPLEVICTLNWRDSRNHSHSLNLVTFKTKF